MKRSPRLTAFLAVLMLLAACVSATPSWALTGPIKEDPVTIGEPSEPGSGGAIRVGPGDFSVQFYFLGQSYVFTWRLGSSSTKTAGKCTQVSTDD